MSSADGATGLLADPVFEARRLLERAAQRDVPLRVLGGVAVAIAVAPEQPLLPRAYQDIDLITVKGPHTALTDLMNESGYLSDEQFNSFNGHRRLLYYDPVHERQVDIFVGTFSMCHEIPLEDRLLEAKLTLPLPELLLTKLQIVELNEKDLNDIFNLLHRHAPTGDGSAPADALDVGQIGALCASDWGLWRTATMNIDRARAALGELRVSSDARELLAARLQTLRAGFDLAAKTRKWKLRARIGDRVRWYEEPEEVA
jgi:hypothetical protein